ncbi:MAG: glycosyltransferase [Selenomonadaceae bacterium]|nr:glycosyltransferase [Selenomonadaceae bacterium]
MTDKQFANTPPLLLANPAISVIIPMYNAEKYIGECLDSLLAQTFQTFEVIVADDCSTDSSCEIIESYMPKFEGRLRLTHTETNSGGCAVPRNVGLPLARGKYVYFMDSDDALTQTGLEEMYTLAEEYDADVVYCERYYMSEGVGKDFIENMHVAKGRLQPPPYVEEPTLESSNLAERVKGILNDRFWFAAWLKLVRHDLLKEHNIFFPYVKPGEDDTWTHALIFFAKKFLRVPNMVYIRRMRDDSIIGTSKTPQQSLNFWFNPILLGLKELDKVMSQIEFFKENPQQHYAILEKQVQGKFRAGLRYAGQLTSTDVYETIKGEFGDKFGGQDILISALCSHIFGQDKALKETQKKLKHTEDVLKKVKDSIAAKESEMINRVENSMSYFLDLRQNGPEVSVVIPMYNAEKYIGELLDSLLAQTFPNFEAIVVDDCSTDNSVIVVESYESRFNGRLKLQKLEKNSGTGGSVPRNVGFKLVRGEYVLFVDADDYLSRFALETFYTAAKKYDADVVYTSAYNLLHRPDMSKVLKDGINQKLLKEKLEDKPTLTIDNPHKNLRQFDMEKSFNFPWTHFVRRDLLARNQIEFPEIPNGVDHLWALQVYCYAKRFLRIPNALYFYRRYQSESISTIKREPREQVSYWISTFTLWLKV